MTDFTNKTAGDMLKTYRIAQGQNQTTVARVLDVTVSFYSAMEKGDKGIPVKLYSKLCQFFQLNSEMQKLLLLKMAAESKQIRINQEDVNVSFPTPIFTTLFCLTTLLVQKTDDTSNMSAKDREFWQNSARSYAEDLLITINHLGEQ